MDANRSSCPFCAEPIDSGAVRCPHCRSRLGSWDPGRWYRDHPTRRLGGVASGLARELALPLGAVRVAFILLILFHGVGALLYLALWLLMPFRASDPPLWRRVRDEVARIWRRLTGKADPPASATDDVLP